MPFRQAVERLTLAFVAPLALAGSPWDDAAALRFQAAHAAWSAMPARSPADDLGLALTKLNLAPKTRENTAAARRILTALVDAEPAGEEGLRARYYLGRIAQIHAYEPDWNEAEGHYRRLIDLAPTHPFAQLALVKLALVRLYAPAPPAEQQARLREMEDLAPLAVHPIARRDFHYVLGVAHLALRGSEERALHHLLVADREGISQARTRATVYVRIGELARKLGREDIAATYYRRFLDEFPREGRATLINEHLAALGEARGGTGP